MDLTWDCFPVSAVWVAFTGPFQSQPPAFALGNDGLFLQGCKTSAKARIENRPGVCALEALDGPQLLSSFLLSLVSLPLSRTSRISKCAIVLSRLCNVDNASPGGGVLSLLNDKNEHSGHNLNRCRYADTVPNVRDWARHGGARL